MKSHQIALYPVFAALFVFSLSANANLPTVGPDTVQGSSPNDSFCQTDTTLSDNNYGTGITVQENSCYSGSIGGALIGGFYNLDNPSDSGATIFGLAVTTNSYLESPGFFGPGTGVVGWTAQFWDETYWNSSTIGQVSGQSFDEVFGPDDVQGIYLYMIANPPTGALSPGTSVTGSTGFYFSGAINTEFAALNSGIVIAQSYQVPAPATLALIGLGLAGLGHSRRKEL